MNRELRSEPRRPTAPASEERPEVSVCESCPGRAVFVESGNGDGWIAIDGAVEVTR